MAAQKRIKAEIEQLEKDRYADEYERDPCEDFSAAPNDSESLSGSPYEGGLFVLGLEFSDSYPWRPPAVQFKTAIYHPNIYSGNVVLKILKTEWSPSITIKDVLVAIRALLANPNPDDPLAPEIAHLYKSDRSKFEAQARESTKKYAM
ncbi:ubiquitin-conjugating enzyme E2 [Penicillium tannophilum]|nr:ubiquitin-conjugating enzyme E2 [Penicillium tannophilum]